MKKDGGGAAAELAEIRALVAREQDGAIPAGMRTVDLVRALMKVAQREHSKLGGIRRQVVALGFRDVGATVTLVRQALGELALHREALEKGEVHALEVEGADRDRVLRMLEAALAAGTLHLSAGASAGMREAMTGDSGAIELALTEHEITDLVLSGVAFTEVGGDGGADVLVKLVDTTGWMRRLRDAVVTREATRAARGPEGQLGQQQPDRRIPDEAIEYGDDRPLPGRASSEGEGEGGEGESGNGV